MENTISPNSLQFIEIKLNRNLCLTTDNPTQEYFYEDLLVSQIKDPDQIASQSTKRKLKDLSVGKKMHKEFNKMITERGINEREALMAMESFSHLGEGYDVSDPFIDDGEICDDCVPMEMRTRIDGFYINEGPVEYYFEDNVDSEFTPTSKRKRKSKESMEKTVEKNKNAESKAKKPPKKTETLSISKFINDYIETWYHVLGYTANLVCGGTWSMHSDPIEALFPLIPPTMDKSILKITDVFFNEPTNAPLDDFVADSPSEMPSLTSLAADLPSGFYQPVISSLHRFLENMDRKRAQKRIDGPRKPDYEDSKILFILYANYRRFGLSSQQWGKILEILAQGLNLGGQPADNVSKIKDYLEDIAKYFCGSIDNVLIVKFISDDALKIEPKKRGNSSPEQPETKKTKKTMKIDITESQKNMIKTIFVLFLMAVKDDKIQGSIFMHQINTFIKYFVKKLGGFKKGINQAILLMASEFALGKIRKFINKTLPPKIHESKIQIPNALVTPLHKKSETGTRDVDTSAGSGKSEKEAQDSMKCTTKVISPSKETNDLPKIIISPPKLIYTEPVGSQSIPVRENSQSGSTSLFSSSNYANSRKSMSSSTLQSSPYSKIPPNYPQFAHSEEQARAFRNMNSFSPPKRIRFGPSSFIQGEGRNDLRMYPHIPIAGSEMACWQNLNNLFMNAQNTVTPPEMTNLWTNNSVYKWDPRQNYNPYPGMDSRNLFPKRPPY